jgi:catechol 2,3-dioxygenase-like lactoylglutathione lyase family enzyme
MPKGLATFYQLAIDCHDAAKLVEFWQPLLGYEVPAPPAPFDTWRDWYLSVGVPEGEIDGDGTDRLVPADGQGVAIWFQPVPENKGVKNRLHLDLRASQGRAVSREQRRREIEPVVARVQAAGGSLIRWTEEPEADHVYAVLADPEGNEFCVN